jgi:hypothetical protein
MDQASIDQLAKALGSALSRRAGFREVIGSALGAAALTADTAAKN